MLKSRTAAPVGLEPFLLTVAEDLEAAKRTQVVNFFKALASQKAAS